MLLKAIANGVKISLIKTIKKRTTTKNPKIYEKAIVAKTITTKLFKVHTQVCLEVNKSVYKSHLLRGNYFTKIY